MHCASSECGQSVCYANCEISRTFARHEKHVLYLPRGLRRGKKQGARSSARMHRRPGPDSCLSSCSSSYLVCLPSFFVFSSSSSSSSSVSPSASITSNVTGRASKRFVLVFFWKTTENYRAAERTVRLTRVLSNSKHWFTTSFLQPLPYLVTP